MITIRDEIGYMLADLGLAYGFRSEVATSTLEALGIDPDLPSEWATVDRCLMWLRERGIVGKAAGWTDGFAVHLVGSERPISAATLHAALIAACKAAQKAS